MLRPVEAGSQDYYAVLGIARNAEPDEIKRAYRRLAKRYHPDLNPGDPAAEEAFKRSSEAYAVLSDPEKRRLYDRFGAQAFSGRGAPEPDLGAFGEVLEGLFGDVFRPRRRRRTGRDLTYEVVVSFVEAARGAEKEITLRRPGLCRSCGGRGAAKGSQIRECRSCKGRGEVKTQRGIFSSARTCDVCGGRGKVFDMPCATCGGAGSETRAETLTVRIPAGVDDGAVRTVRGAGEVAIGGAGDLHLTIRVEPHPLFDRKGADIHCTIPISFPQAVLGTAVDVPTLDGKVRMRVPPGTQSGKVLRLRGKGIETYGGTAKGDQLVTVMVEIPIKISRKQRKLIEELASEMGEETHPQQRGFLDKLRSLFD